MPSGRAPAAAAPARAPLTRRPRLAAVGAAIAIGLLAAPALAGCSVQGIVKNATGGNVDIGGASVPSDFPKRIPLVDGTVVAGAGLGTGEDKVWNVTVRVSGQNPLPGIKDQLTGAGFAAEGDLDLSGEDGGTVFLSDDDYGVTVLAGKTDGAWSVNYTVTPKAK